MKGQSVPRLSRDRASGVASHNLSFLPILSMKKAEITTSQGYAHLVVIESGVRCGDRSRGHVAYSSTVAVLHANAEGIKFGALLT